MHLDIQCSDEYAIFTYTQQMEFTDALLKGYFKASRGTLQSLQLWAVGDPSLWDSLSTRLGNSLSSLSIADWNQREPLRTHQPTAVQQAINSTYHRWTCLHSIEIHLGPTPGSVAPLQGLAAVPNLLHLTFHVCRSASQSASIASEEIGRFVPLCRNLRKVTTAPDTSWTHVVRLPPFFPYRPTRNDWYFQINVVRTVD